MLLLVEKQTAAFRKRVLRRGSEALEAAGVIDHFELCDFKDVKGKYKIDGYSFDEVDASLTVCVSEWSGQTATTTLAPKDARLPFNSLISLLQAIVSSKYTTFIDSGDPAFDFALTLLEQLPQLKKIRALLLTDMLLSTRVKDWPEGTLAGIPIEFYIWDIARFHRAFESQSGLDEIEVSLSHLPDGGLPCLKASLSDAGYQGYLTVLPASELSRIYQQFGSRLLEGNVRAFLSTKGKVNQGIRRTLLQNPSMFFAYNNGISVLRLALQWSRTRVI